MGSPPPQVVIDAFNGSTVDLNRRIEIYETDGITPWKNNMWSSLLISGSVTLDYSRDERRNFDVVLDNITGELNHGSDNFWYDKVIKPFYGIRVDEPEKDPVILIIEEYNLTGEALALKGHLNAKGFNKVRINTALTTYDQIGTADVLVSLSSDYPRKTAILQQAYNAGLSVFTMSGAATTTQLPLHISTVNTAAAVSNVFSPFSSGYTRYPIAISNGWDISTFSTQTISTVSAIAAGAVIGANYNGTSAATLIATEKVTALGKARWVHMVATSLVATLPASGEQNRNMLASQFGYLKTYVPIKYWETQIGEFMIDAISDTSEDSTINVTCRDYTKRCLLSKLLTATSTLVGQTVESQVRTFAVNSGITKFKLPGLTTLLSTAITYERNTPRWTVMKELATAVGHELFFDNEGYLVMRPYQDPLLTPASLALLTGPDVGNLIKVGRKVGDARLFNIVNVYGESTDSTKPPVSASAKNTMASSPSRIARLGERVTSYSSPLLTTTLQCQTLANSLLKIAALEEFEVSFESILYPWMEAGEIVEYYYERFVSREVYRFLLSSLTLPMDLSPMSGTTKRVVVVL